MTPTQPLYRSVGLSAMHVCASAKLLLVLHNGNLQK